MSRSRLTVAATTTALALGALGLTAPAAHAAPYCGLTWGSLAKQAAPMVPGPVTGVRAGEQPCYDRLVLDLGSAPAGGYSVAYVDQVHADGSGAVIPTRGGARLQVVAHAPAYSTAGVPTYLPANRSEVVPVAGYRTFAQVVWANSVEGYTSPGLGVRARLPFRVMTLTGPGSGSRLVVDVAHAW